MKRTLLRAVLLPLLAFLLALTGCSGGSSSPADPPAPEETPLATAGVGPEGGVLAADGFALTVPAGALDATVALALYADEAGSAFAGGEAAPVFRIEGLPAGLDTALPLRLAHGSATGDSLQALIGGPSYVPSRQESALTWAVADCADSAGWALLELPAADPAAGKDGATAAISVTVIRGVAETLTADDRFKIYWSPAMATEAQIAALKGNLEIAMSIYDSMGFQQDGFAGWPVKAIVRPMEGFGYWAPDPHRLGGHLAFSSTWIGDADEMRLTAGHELLHFCQYFYDPRTVWERGSFAGPLVWLEEATAVYIEDYFAPDQDYCSAARGGRELAPLDGLLVAGPGHTMGQHGYGLSGLIRYLAQTEGDGFLLDTFELVKAGRHPAAALQEATTTDLPDRWMDLLEELVTGGIYADVTMSVLMDYPLPTLLAMGTAADSVGTYQASYPDLSGRLISVSWYDSMEFAPNQRLELWADVPEYGISVFGLRFPSTRTLLGHAYGKVTLTNLPALKENHDDLLVLVSNQRLAGPEYLGPTTITLEGRLRATEPPAGYDHGLLNLRYEADWSNGQHLLYQDMSFSEVPGVFDGSTFTASWDSTGSSGWHYAGHLNVSFDPVDLHALSWSARNYAWSDEGASSLFAASGGELARVPTLPPLLEARADGVAVCADLNEVTVIQTSNDGEVTRSLNSWTCNSGSYVQLRLRDTDLR